MSFSHESRLPMAMFRLPAFLILLGFATTISLGLIAHAQDAEKPADDAEEEKEEPGEAPRAEIPEEGEYAWRSLFDGKTLEGWMSPGFGGGAEPRVEDGVMIIPAGVDMAGVRHQKGEEFPKVNYEIELEARRDNGVDFFATTTFPYKDECCSLVIGGWGGMVIGISCVDGYDASENETCQWMQLKDDVWYRIRIRVSEDKIEAWVNELDEKDEPIKNDHIIRRNGNGDERVVNLITNERKISTRIEVDLCRPFGITTWCTEGHIRNIRTRNLPKSEVEAITEEAEASIWW
jgi:hypothetical protein